MIPEWLWSILVGIVVIGLIVTVRRGDTRRIDQLEVWRDERERQAREFYALATRIEGAEKRIQELKDWKHLVIDPYIPRAVDEHERRLDRIELKIFNGHK